MNRKITPEQAAHIRHLVKVDHLKLREVAEQYPVIGLAQIHRIASGTNWQRVTHSPKSLANPPPRNENR